MTQPNNTTVAGFFSGGSKAVKFEKLGDSVNGVITAIHPPEYQTDMKTKQPIPDGRGGFKLQIRIDLQTNLRDPSIDNDDGQRTLYVKGWMRGALGDALRVAGAQQPEIGGVLTVTYNDSEPSSTPGFDPTKKFVAQYVKPTPNAAAAGQFLTGGAPGQPPAPNGYGQVPQPAPQQGFQGAYPPPGGYQQPPVAQAPQQVPGYVGAPPPAPAGPEPERPAAISEQAWAAMDPATKAQTAQIMANVPPF